MQGPPNSWLWLVGLSSSVLTFLIAAVWKPYLKKYAEEMAVHLATREQFKQILNQAFERVYSEEVARRKATHDDFENVIAELKKVTLATKTIEANISEGYWLRQMVWTQKMDTYVRTLRAFADQESAWRTTIAALRQSDSELEKIFGGVVPELNKKLEEMERAASIVELMLSADAANIVHARIEQLRNLDVDHIREVQAPKSELEEVIMILEVCMGILRDGRKELVREAKIELGLNPSSIRTS